MSDTGDIHEVINQVYATAVEPEHYDELMEAWDAFFAAAVENGDEDDGLHLVEEHFRRGIDVLDSLSKVEPQQHTAQSIVDAVDGIGLIFDHSGALLASNAGALDRVGAETASTFGDLQLDTNTIDALKAWFAAVTSALPSHRFLPVLVGPEKTPSCFLLKRLENPDRPDETATLISSVDIYLDDNAFLITSRTFGLSLAESQIAVALVNGRKPAEIAEMRSSSLQTVRTQIKSILKKTKARSVPDLVRLLAGLSQNHLGDQAPSSGNGEVAQTGTRQMVLPDGRRLAFLDVGPATGRPVLIFHNMLYSSALPSLCIDACQRLGWRIIIPSRPGYGASDSVSDLSDTKLIDQVVEDARWLLDQLNIQSASILGQISGSIYAQRFALTHPARTASLIFVSHAPYWHDSFLSDLPVRQRVIARTTRYARTALPFLTSAGVALIKSGRHDQFIRALHKDIPEDMRALRRPEVYDCVVEGLRHTVQQGSAGFCSDCPLVLTDWSSEGARLKHPPLILVGDGDRVVTHKYVDGYLEQVPDAVIKVIPQAGQHLLFSHWPRVFETLQSGLLAA